MFSTLREEMEEQVKSQPPVTDSVADVTPHVCGESDSASKAAANSWELDVLQHQLLHLKKHNVLLQRKCASLSANFEGGGVDLNAIVQELEGEIELLQTRNAELAQEVEQLRSQTRNSRRANTLLQQQVDDRQIDIQRIQKELLSTQTVLAELRASQEGGSEAGVPQRFDALSLLEEENNGLKRELEEAYTDVEVENCFCFILSRVSFFTTVP
jgi:chromosome segregation ATPase